MNPLEGEIWLLGDPLRLVVERNLDGDPFETIGLIGESSKHEWPSAVTT